MDAPPTHIHLRAGAARCQAEAVGFRLGAKGTHSSRTVMLAELAALLAASDTAAARRDYLSAIVDANCLSKPTAATRQLSGQRLSELYGLEPKLPLFRVLRRLWDADAAARPLLAILAAIARDPLFAVTAPSVVDLPPGAEFQRAPMKAALRAAAGERLNPAILDKACRNAASSWTQSGHLQGRTFKIRHPVAASAAAVAFALYLAHAAAFRGPNIFASPWLWLIDCDPSQARHLALEAKRLGLIGLKAVGDVVELDTARLDPAPAGA